MPVNSRFFATSEEKNRPHRISPTRSVWLFNLCLSRILSALKQHLCQDTLSEPASVQIHLFFKFNIVSWLNFCLCAYSHIFLRKNSVIQIYVFAFGTLLLALVSLKSHFCSSSISASTSVDLCRDTSDTTQICWYLRYNAKMSVYLR